VAQIARKMALAHMILCCIVRFLEAMLLDDLILELSIFKTKIVKICQKIREITSAIPYYFEDMSSQIPSKT
jgi:hypothetical protein